MSDTRIETLRRVLPLWAAGLAVSCAVTWTAALVVGAAIAGLVVGTGLTVVAVALALAAARPWRHRDPAPSPSRSPEGSRRPVATPTATIAGEGESLAWRLHDLEERERWRDELLSTASHEFRTSLNGIMGFAESLLLGYYGAVDEENREPLETIHGCAQGMSRTTESVLRLFRLGARPEETVRLHTLREHLATALADLEIGAERAGLRLRNSVPAELNVAYPAGDLEQILRILVENAIKFTPRGEVELLGGRWHGVSPGFQVGVRDTGIGLAKEHRTRVFEPFFRCHHGDPRRRDGGGLGLTIAKRLAERFGGEILLESEEGRGSTFTLLVPEQVPQVPVRELFEPWERPPEENLVLEADIPARESETGARVGW